jgi:ABC-2 type transport system ATP-binding protein
LSEVIELRGLGQRYGRRWVLRDLTASIEGGITVLLGPNGAGKTTLLSTIAGLRRPAAGAVTISGVETVSADRRRRLAREVGFLPQDLGYYPNYTVREFLAYGAWLKRVPAGEVAAAVESALAATGLGEVAGRKMKHLSGGTARRAGIAHALVHRPRLVLLDEPASGLDPHQRIEMRRLLRGLAADTAALISTHHVDDLPKLADRVLVLDDGVLRFAGTPGELAERGATADAEGDSPLERGYSAVCRRVPAGTPQ